MVEQVRKNVEVELQPILDPDDVNVTRVNVVEVRQSRPRASILNNPVFKASLRNLVLIVTWYFFSTVLSLWNRRLLGQNQGVLGKGPFPAPMLMSSLQFASQIIMANTVLLLGVVKRRAPEGATWSNYFSQVVPNGVCTGLDIGLSNFSLSLITLSFYTMCKSTTPIFLLVFAFLWGIERPSWSLAGVVAVISLGLTLLVAGETQFNMVGFVLVMLASMLSGLRWTITQVLLQGSDHQGKLADGIWACGVESAFHHVGHFWVGSTWAMVLPAIVTFPCEHCQGLAAVEGKFHGQVSIFPQMVVWFRHTYHGACG
eukprot:jgi/Botrbrau1/4220/Bobra.0044s0018.7